MTRTRPALWKPCSFATATRNPAQKRSQAGKHAEARLDGAICGAPGADGSTPFCSLSPKTEPNPNQKHPKKPEPPLGWGCSPLFPAKGAKEPSIASYDAAHPQTSSTPVAGKATFLT